MSNKLKSELTIGDIVANDFRAASIFKNEGIDFCCGGKNSLSQVCKEKGIDFDEMVLKLNELELIPVSEAQNFKEWELGFLCDYIINTHHKFVQNTLPNLLFYTNKIATVHGHNHPELNDVSDVVKEMNKELLEHLRREEDIFFPAIKEALKNNSEASKNIIANEIVNLTIDHDLAGRAMDGINAITNQYHVPADACGTYNLTFKLLQQFEDDLHVHVHLENNILYPKALLLTK